MSGIRVDQNILNQKGTPAFNAAPFVARPAAGFVGRIFISTNTYQIFRDEGTGWSLIADAGSGSSNLEQVTFNGNNTPYGINITNGGLFLLGSVNGGIFFADGGSGQFTQDATTLFWDNTNKRLGLGTATPSAKLDIHSSSGTTATFNGTGVTNAVTSYQSAGTSKWSIGNYVSSAVANDFCIYDNVNTAYRLYVHNTGVVNIPTSLIIGSSTPTSSYTFDVTGSGKFSSTLTLGTILQGSVLFAGAGGLVNQNNSNFFWDNTNNRLGIGNTTPVTAVDIRLVTPDSTNGSVLNSYPISSFVANGSGGGSRGLQISAPTSGISSPVTLSVFGTSQRFAIANSSNVEQLTISNSGQVGINTGSSISASAILQATSTTQGFLPPVMTTTQKNAISSPATGLVIFDSTLGKLCVYSTTWQTITSV